MTRQVLRKKTIIKKTDELVTDAIISEKNVHTSQPKTEMQIEFI